MALEQNGLGIIVCSMPVSSRSGKTGTLVMCGGKTLPADAKERNLPGTRLWSPFECHRHWGVSADWHSFAAFAAEAVGLALVRRVTIGGPVLPTDNPLTKYPFCATPDLASWRAVNRGPSSRSLPPGPWQKRYESLSSSIEAHRAPGM